MDAFDDIVPWEKDLYVNLLSAKVEEENEKLKLQESERRARRAR